MADYTVSGAGTSAYNGDYTQNGTFNGQPKYEISGGGRWLFYANFIMEMSEGWALDVTVQDYYMGTDVAYSATTITGTWYVGYGSSPAPTVAAASGSSTHSIAGAGTGTGTATATLSIVAGGTTHSISGTASGESTATATLSIVAGGTKARIAAGTTLSINGELIGSIMHINAVGGGTAEIVATTNHQSDYRYTEGMQGLRSFGELQFAGAAISTEKFASVGAVEFEVAYPGQTSWRGAGFITKVVTGAAIDEMIPYAITAQICIICSGIIEASYSLAEHPYIENLGVFGDLSTGSIDSWIWDFGDGTGLYYEALEGGVTGYEIDDMVAWLADNTQGRGDPYSSATIPTEILHAYGGSISGDWIVSGAGDDSYNGTYVQDGTYNGRPAYVKTGLPEQTYITTLTVRDLCGSDTDTHSITLGEEVVERWLYKAYVITDMEYIWVFNNERIDVDVLRLDVAYYSSSTVGGTWYLANGDAPAPTLTEA